MSRNGDYRFHRLTCWSNQFTSSSIGQTSSPVLLLVKPVHQFFYWSSRLTSSSIGRTGSPVLLLVEPTDQFFYWSSRLTSSSIGRVGSPVLLLVEPVHQLFYWLSRLTSSSVCRAGSDSHLNCHGLDALQLKIHLTSLGAPFISLILHNLKRRTRFTNH